VNSGEPQRVRVGLIGSGFAARLHAEAYRHVPGVNLELRAVASVRPERAAAFAAEFHVGRAVADPSVILDDPEIDAVDLCLPSHLHARFAVRAARAGKHVIVEKPLTGFFGPAETPRAEMLRIALDSADAVIGAARAAGVRLCYAENWVYAPPVQKARRLLAASGGLILRLVGEESHSGTHAPINKRWETGGGGSLLGKGCHPLGAALYLKADEGRRLRGVPVRAVSVTAEVARLADTPAFRASSPQYLNTVERSDVEDWGSMLIGFDDGTTAQISASDAVLGGIRNQLAIYGAKAVVLCNINPNDAVQAYAPDARVFGDEYITEKIETKAGWTFPQPDEDWMTGYPQEIEDFVQCIALGREPLSGGALARDVTLVLYGAYLSAAEGRRVDLRPLLADADRIDSAPSGLRS
jgi:predicted dehydrogenase